MVQSSQKDRWLPFSLIVGTEEGGELGPLTVDVPSRGRALAAFSFPEEAWLYLRLSAPRGRWAVVEAAPEELVRILLGPLCNIGCVALDPMAEGVDTRLAVALVSMSREDFLSFVSRRRGREWQGQALMYGTNAGSGLGSTWRR